MTAGSSGFGRPIALGLRDNWRQFALLMLVNAFVGGRTVSGSGEQS